MFFFYGSKELLTADEEATLAKNSAEIVKRLISVTEAKGLRNSDLANLTNWNASKISKLINNKQKLSPDDLKAWAMCLGYTPRVFLDEDSDIRNFNLSKDVRNILDCLNQLIMYQGKLIDEEMENDVVRYEMPLSIINVLQVEPTDYVVEGHINYDEFALYDPSTKTYEDKGVTIKLQHRNVQIKDGLHIVMRCDISPDRKTMILGVYMFAPAESLHPNVRAANKDILLVDENVTKRFDSYAREHQDWISVWMRNGEIFSFIYDTAKLPDEAGMESDLHIVFDKYCDLVYAKSNGVDIKGRNKVPSVGDIFRMMTGGSEFSSETIIKVLKSRGYKCEVNPDHESFLDDGGNRYMEVVPLIPFEHEITLGQGLQSEANGLCLCPMCSAKYKHGRKQERAQMVFSLFGQHEEALKNNGVDIAISQALGFNGL